MIAEKVYDPHYRAGRSYPRSQIDDGSEIKSRWICISIGTLEDARMPVPFMCQFGLHRPEPDPRQP